MSILVMIAKIFASIFAFGGILASIFYIYAGYKKPIHGTVAEIIAGLIMGGLSVYGMYWIWI